MITNKLHQVWSWVRCFLRYAFFSEIGHYEEHSWQLKWCQNYEL